MYKIFIGYDYRQPVSYTVLQQSIIAQASEPVSITPLVLDTLPIKRQGLTPFTWSRFLVPALCNYEGYALFLDVDIVLNGDICQLFELVDSSAAVSVSKSEHKFEWASVMLFNCAHPDNRMLTPEYIETTTDHLHKISWTENVGDLPREWNHLVGYDQPKDAKLVHFTQGVPAYPETQACEYANLWRKYSFMSVSTLPWAELMGNSIHAANVNGKMLPRFLFDEAKGVPHEQYKSVVQGLLKAS